MADINPSRPTQDTTPADVIAAAFSWLPRQVQRNRIATEALDALKAAGYAIVNDTTIAEIRALHQRGMWTATGTFYCRHCLGSRSYRPPYWPCPTIQILDRWVVSGG